MTIMKPGQEKLATLSEADIQDLSTRDVSDFLYVIANCHRDLAGYPGESAPSREARLITARAYSHAADIIAGIVKVPE